VGIAGAFENLQLEKQWLQRRSRSADNTRSQFNPTPEKWNVHAVEEFLKAYLAGVYDSSDRGYASAVPELGMIVPDLLHDESTYTDPKDSSTAAEILTPRCICRRLRTCNGITIPSKTSTKSITAP